jgi:hypothetical protein
MARKKYRKPETREWDWHAPAPTPLTDDSPVRIDDVDGVKIEIRKRPGMGLVMRPPSYTTVGPDGLPYTERVVATAWFISHYQPWRRLHYGHTAPDLPASNVLDGLLPDIAVEEEDHERFSDTE